MEGLWLPLWTSLRVAVIATLLAVPVGVGLAWLSVNGRLRRAEWLDGLILLPLLLPAPVFGYYLVVCLGEERPTLFSETVAIIAAALYTIPLTAVLANRVFREIDPVYTRLATSLGASSWQVFREVSLPLSSRALASIAILGVARSFAEFGATLLAAPRFPNGATTLPIALYNAMSGGANNGSHLFAAVMVTITVLMLALSRYLRAGRLL